MDSTLMYVVYAVIILVVLILLYYFVYPTSYTLYATPMLSSNGICLTNDAVTSRTFKSSGKMDGIFYETLPYAGTCQYALLVVAGAATDYYTNMTGYQKLANIVSTSATPNVTSSSPTYIGVFVSATNGVVDTDITATGASASTWLGVCDLTVLMANLVASGKPITSIGTFTGTFPTVSKTAVPTTSILATSTTSWPMMPITSSTGTPTNIAAISGVSGNGLAISCNKCFSTIYDSIYYHKGVATSTVQPTPPAK